MQKMILNQRTDAAIAKDMRICGHSTMNATGNRFWLASSEDKPIAGMWSETQAGNWNATAQQQWPAASMCAWWGAT